MRTAILLLILANVLLFGYALLDRAARSEAGRLSEQVQPDRISILTSQQVAALGPGKVAALADVCVEWGPFSDIRSCARAGGPRAAATRPPASRSARSAPTPPGG